MTIRFYTGFFFFLSQFLLYWSYYPQNIRHFHGIILNTVSLHLGCESVCVCVYMYYLIFIKSWALLHRRFWPWVWDVGVSAFSARSPMWLCCWCCRPSSETTSIITEGSIESRLKIICSQVSAPPIDMPCYNLRELLSLSFIFLCTPWEVPVLPISWGWFESSICENSLKTSVLCR